jgi:HSP20 family protein
MERYVEHISRRKPRAVVFSRATWEPAVDLYEVRDAVVALVDLAGVPEDEIDLVVERDTLTLRGERQERGERAERRYCYLEIPFGPFQRTLHLPCPVDPQATRAVYRSGFLEIVMPKLATNPQRIILRNE